MVAQVAAGASAAGFGALLSHPAMAPLWGALAALVLALIQAAIRKLNGQGASTQEQQAIQKAAEAAAVAAVRAAMEQAQGSTPPASKRPPKPPALPILLVLALALGGCAGWTARDYAVASINTAAEVGNEGGEAVLDTYCTVQLRAANRTGMRHPESRACVADPPARASTPDEAAAVGQVRRDWDPVMDALVSFQYSHDMAVNLARAADAADEDITKALFEMVKAYGALARLVARFGVTLPPLLNPEGN
jgi:hypothetical protein